MNYVSEKIIPAVMPKSFDHLQEEMGRFVGLVPLVQVDVMDGKFTESKSWPYMNGTDSEFLKIINQEEGFPFWESLDVEADLMVTDPAKAADQWIAAGAARIVVHLESAAPDEISSVLSSIKEKGIEAGLAVGLETSIEIFKDFYEKNREKIDSVQFMGIEKIGFQGQPFAEQVIERIKDFHDIYPDTVIAIDGGVNHESAPLLAEAGVTRLVIGSALREGSPEESIESFNVLL